jgi:cutinase
MPAGAGDARAHVENMAANCPNTRMALGGYSQGAGVIDMATESIRPQVANHVAAVALFGNPESTFARTLGGGRLPTISPLYRPKTIDLCVPDDPICSEGRNPAAHVAYIQSGDDKPGGGVRRESTLAVINDGQTSTAGATPASKGR